MALGLDGSYDPLAGIAILDATNQIEDGQCDVLTRREQSDLSDCTTVAEVADEVLLREFVKSGNRAAFEKLVRRYQLEIYNYLRRYMGDDDQAEDAFQLTFVKVYKKVEQFDLERRFRPWLYGIATHQAIDLKRRNKRRLHASLDVGSMSDESYGASQSASIPDHRVAEQDPLEAEELRMQLRDAIAEVGEPGRSALELIYLQSMPYRDAAEILGVPVGTVKSRVHAAVRKLATIWKRKEEEGSR